jgi:hypothetical protein
LPSSAENIPSKITTSPLPPESTTPTSFKIGNKFGVFSRDLFDATITCWKNSVIVASFFTFLAAIEASLITVKIVPSIG